MMERPRQWISLFHSLAINRIFPSIGKFRLIRKWKATDAPPATARLREGLLDRSNTASDIWADTAYRSKANEDFMEKHSFVPKVHRKKSHLKLMSCHVQRSNAGKSVVRSRGEHVFADQKSQTGLFPGQWALPVSP